MSPFLWIVGGVLFTAVGYLVLLWALRKAATWLLIPGPAPESSDETDRAIYAFRVAVSQALRPPLERLTAWLSRRLPPPRKPDDPR